MFIVPALGIFLSTVLMRRNDRRNFSIDGPKFSINGTRIKGNGF
jgi:hypothetical protein